MPDSSRILKVAIPKGSLQEPTIELLAKAGYEIYVSSRGLRPSSNDPELDLYLIRAQEIGRYLGQGFIDCGITGTFWTRLAISSFLRSSNASVMSLISTMPITSSGSSP